MESRIKLVKQYSREMIGKVKGQNYEPLSLTETDNIMVSAIHEINSIPLVKNEKYVFVAQKNVVNPYLEVSVKDAEGDLLSKYYERMKVYVDIVEKLHLNSFVRYAREKRVVNHK